MLLDGPRSSGGGSSDAEHPVSNSPGDREQSRRRKIAQGQMRHLRCGKLGVGRARTSEVPRSFCDSIGSQSRMGLAWGDGLVGTNVRTPVQVSRICKPVHVARVSNVITLQRDRSGNRPLDS